jgi:hypothetical protein
MAKKTVARKIRNIVISTFVLLILFVGAGVAYTFYMSQTDPVATVAKAPVSDKKTTLKHTKLAANAPASAAIQMLTSPVMPGDNASVTVKGNPGSNCTISVKYNEVASTDSGLKPKVTDEFGVTTWAWTVEPTVPEGSWPVSITCEYNKKTAVVIQKIVISKTIVE